MGNLRTSRRKLDKQYVYLGEQTNRAKHELAMKLVSERVKTDAAFAAEVLKLAGEYLREDIKKDANETIAREKLLPEKV